MTTTTSNPTQRERPMNVDTIDLVERLRHPLWVHSNAPFGSPQLDKETTEIDLAKAADVICQYRADCRHDEQVIASLKARIQELEGALRDWQDSSEEYRADAEVAADVLRPLAKLCSDADFRDDGDHVKIGVPIRLLRECRRLVTERDALTGERK